MSFSTPRNDSLASNTAVNSLDIDIANNAASKNIEIISIWIPILLLIITLSPGIGSGEGITLSKAITGGLIVLLTLPGIAASLINLNKFKGKGVLLAFLMMTILNILVAMSNHLSLSYWLRIGFGSYVFVATILAVTYYANTANRRHNLWVWLVIFLTLYSCSRWVFAFDPSGFEEAIEARSFGAKAGPLVATMVLLPALGNLLLKSFWIFAAFYSNLALLILSCSRTNYILLGVGTLYTILFVQHGFIKRFLYLFFITMLGVIFMNLPGVYEQMVFRFAWAGKDESSLRRMDQTLSAIKASSENFQSLIFGKGYGTPYKVRYKLARAGGFPFSRDEIEIMGPHNDYACRLLYCGLFGLTLHLLVFIVFGYVFRAAIKRFDTDNIDPYARVRIHGAMLVIIYMAIFGFAGGNFYLWNNNIFQGCALGLGLAEATEILSSHRGTKSG
jgi:hypothetical protein